MLRCVMEDGWAYGHTGRMPGGARRRQRPVAARVERGCPAARAPHLASRAPSPPAAKQKAKWDSYLRWGIEYDCPIFPGLFNFCRQYAAASIGACGRASRWALLRDAWAWQAGCPASRPPRGCPPPA